MQLLSNQSLRAFNTFGIDCVARHFAEFNTEEDLTSLLDTPEVKKNKRLILGGGSNLLFTQPFDGVVLKNNLHGIELIEEDNDHYYVRAQAGENWHSFVMHCIDRNYAGVENLSLIPGCVGASPMQNIGAYGVELKDVFHRLEAIHIEDKHKHTFELAECSFGYPCSKIFQWFAVTFGPFFLWIADVADGHAKVFGRQLQKVLHSCTVDVTRTTPKATQSIRSSCQGHVLNGTCYGLMFFQLFYFFCFIPFHAHNDYRTHMLQATDQAFMLGCVEFVSRCFGLVKGRQEFYQLISTSLHEYVKAP
jgi:UDP-N-acetylenolpyruvoylglucosamine reductase